MSATQHREDELDRCETCMEAIRAASEDSTL